MKILISKIASIIVLSFLAYITLFLGLLSMSESKNIVDPYIDTVFAKNYSPQKFDRIEIGMKVFEAKKIVGEPLYKGNGSNDSINVTYYYTGDAKLINANIKSDFAWYRSSFKINKEAKIIDVDKGWTYD